MSRATIDRLHSDRHQKGEIFDLHLPNAYGCIQSALYQLERGNTDRVRAFLEAAQRSLTKAGIHTN